MTPPTSKVVLRSLYRSLLRASAPFSPPSPSAAAYASLIHRSGVSHDWEECIHKLDSKRRAADSKRKAGPEKQNNKERNLPKSWAQNLSRSYSELQDEYTLRKEYFEETYGADYPENRWVNDDVAPDLAMGTSSYYKYDDEYIMEYDPKFILFRQLLREFFAAEGSGCDVGYDGGKRKMLPKWTPDGQGYFQNRQIKQVPLMRFPSQISSDGGLSIRELIQREFRAISVEERLSEESKSKEEAETEAETEAEEDTSDLPTSERPATKTIYPPSSYVDNEIRCQTAFYTLMELNRKLAWAENIIGFPIQKRKQSAQAAKGVSLFPNTDPNDIANIKPDESNSEADSDCNRAKKPSSPLQCGTYLIAHPLMTGYFAKSVIVLLSHEEETSEKTEEGVTGGGSYGVIVNRLALTPEVVVSPQRKLELLRQEWEEKKLQQPKEEHAVFTGNTLETSTSKNSPSTFEESNIGTAQVSGTTTSSPTKSSSPVLRPISLLQAINADDLPDTVQMAFGDAPVREGGPVNMCLQMIHRKAPDRKSDGSKEEEEESGKNNSSPSKIGGTILGSEEDDTILFGGDIIKASYAVLDGDCDREDFSFIIGAACWSPGQLETEIERGCWLPFQGPPQMAMTGMCEHDEPSSVDRDEDEDTVKGTKLSLFPPRPSNAPALSVAGSTRAASQQPGISEARPVSDLWLSVMCALGEGEADLAYMMLDNKNVKNKLGDACDNFERS